MNIAQTIERGGSLFPEKPALRFEGEVWRYGRLDEESSRAANLFLGLGIARGDRVALVMQNTPPLVAAYFGALKLGASVVAINADLKAEELAYILNDSGARIAVAATEPEGFDRAAVPSLERLLRVEGAGDEAWDALLLEESPDFQAVAMGFDEPAALLYTSGTTGFPKGVILSHGNVISNVRACVEGFGFTAEDRILLPLSIHHCFGQNAALNPCFEAGATLLLHRRFDLQAVLRSIAEESATVLFGVPTLYEVLCAAATPAQLRSVRRFVSAAARLPAELARRWVERFERPISEGYGLTEAQLLCLNRGGPAGSVGTPLAGIELKVIDAEGQAAAPGEAGELAVRGPNVTRGYWNHPEDTAAAIRDGWFLTGDIGRADASGCFYLLDRVKDMINVGGVKVYPSEVENLLIRHPAVAEAAVYGIPDGLLGEQVAAALVLKPGQTATVAELLAHCQRHLADFKVPAHLECVEALPKSPTGKILKRLLAENRHGEPATSPATEPATGESLSAWLVRWVAAKLDRQPESIAIDRPFAEQGMTSILVVAMAEALSRRLRRKIEPVIAWSFPTIASLTRHLAGPAPGAAEASETSQDADDRHGFSGDFDPIAIIGMGCRFPGGADSPAAFWELLRNGVDAVGEIPATRWDVERFYDPDPEAPGKTYTRSGAFLDGIDQFDARFFDIPPREAHSLDPQQRLLLEVAWESLEHAGLPPDALKGSRSGVFVGLYFDDYSTLRLYGAPAEVDGYRLLSSLRSMAAGRIAYALGLQGPALQLDTACSSSLLAAHLACQSLRDRECDLALAGGVNLMLSPENLIGLCKMKAVSADGRCKTFDAKADGFGRGEGVGLAVLKRHADALRDGDTVYALIRGSAANNDGASNGLTVPNGMAQEAVVRQALRRADVAPERIQYVEAHGTGTALGDPIEVLALAKVLGTQRPAPFYIGSVKTNIGHLESAAGIAALLKTALALHHGEIPPSLHYAEPNPHIPWQDLPVRVPTAVTPWPEASSRLAGVSAFGMSGTNVHMVLEAPPATIETPATDGPDRPAHLLCLSARTEAALRDLARRHAERCRREPETALGDLAFSVHTGRAQLAERLAVVAESYSELAEQLEHFANGEASSVVIRGRAVTQARDQIAFLFTGQGAQYAGMGRELFLTQPSFRRTLEHSAEVLREHMDRPLLELLYTDAEPSLLNQTAYTQPALFALEYALAELWRSWGIEPDILLGHSVGEYVAACLAGVFSLEDGLKLIAARGRLMQELPLDGAMAAVMADESRVRAALAPHGEDIAIATLNGPSNVVISGRRRVVAAVSAELSAAGVKATPLEVSHAFHSPLMEPMLEAFRLVAAGVAYAPPQKPLISNLHGGLAGDEVASPDYWVQHVREAVRFADGMRSLEAQGVGIFLEIGPKPTLLGMGRQCVAKAENAAWLPSLRPGRGDWRVLLESLGALQVRGYAVDWRGFDRDYARRKLPLPTYPWQHQRYWLEPATPKTMETALRPFIDRRIDLPLHGEIVFETELSTARYPFLNDHRVYGAVVSPAACHLAMVLSGAELAFGAASCRLADVVFPTALALAEEETRKLQLVFGPKQTAEAGFQLISLAAGEASTHASGRWMADPDALDVPESLDTVRQRCPEAVAPDAVLATLSEHIVLGPSFRWVAEVWRGEGEALGRLARPAAVERWAGQPLHPGLLDACFQMTGVVRDAGDAGFTLLPFALDSLRLSRPAGEAGWCHVRRVAERRWDIELYDAEGILVAEIADFSLRPAAPEALGAAPWRDWLYTVEWRARPGFGLAAADLPTPPTWRDNLQATTAKLLTGPELDNHAKALAELETACLAYVWPLFAGLGWAVGDLLAFEALAERLAVIPRYRRLLARLLAMLAEAEILSRDGEAWRVLRTPEAMPPETPMDDLRERYGALIDPEWTLVQRCGDKLADVLRGQQDPLELLFAGGDASIASRLYRDAPDHKAMNHLLQEAARVAVDRLPAERGLRVLEIGAGTGGTSSWVLPILPAERTEYVYTDLGAAFLAQAKHKFSDYGCIRYRTLDIEQPPADQDFPLHHYDLIIAANVLHATRQLPETLAHVRQLLAPGGSLLLYEVTTRRRWIDLCFGLTEGWWRYADQRGDHPLLAPEEWRRVLGDAGFESVAVVPDPSSPEARGYSLIIAQASPPAKIEGKPWLIFSDAGGLGDALAAELHRRGEPAVRVWPGRAFRRIDDSRYEIRESVAEDYRQLLSAWPELRGVVHLGGLTHSAPEAAEDLAAATRQGCGAALLLAQALLAKPAAAPLWLVTRAALAVAEGDSVSGVAGATLWGMGQVIALEHPELRATRVDLDDAMTVADQAAALRAEITADAEPPENQVAWRQGRRLVARLARVQEHAEPPAIHGVGTYLITGGLTGVGLRIAQGLLDRGARHVLLVGRRPPSAEAQGQIDAWNQQGAVVKTAQADVADATALAAVLAAIDPSQPLRGLIHSVGVLEDAALVQQDWTRFAKVLAPKMLGAWHLHALTQDLPLDFFVLFSSMAGFLGSRGQANHAAANTFLDAFAAYRRARGLKASSIAWGAWSEIGAAAELIRRGGGERLAAQGFGIIAPEQGVKAFAEVLGLDKALIGVVPIDWAVFARQWARSDPFFSGLLATARQQPEARIQAGEDWRERLAATPAAALPECLLAYLEAQAVEILGFGPEESLDGNQPLNQVGLDSLMSIDLRSRVTRDLGLTLPVDVFMDASIAQLSARLATALANESAPAESPVTIPSVSRLGALPLSFMQEEVWRRSQIPALKGVYNLLSRFRFTGRLDRGVLRQSLDALVARHEILRTTYAVVDARPAQIIGPPAEVPLAVTDLRTLPEAAKAQAIERLATEEEGRPFDLERGPLLRAHLLELGDAAHLLLVATHHIAVDAWSINLLFTELGALYAAGIRGEPMALPAESIQYADFAHWQRATHTPETLVSRQAYWRELLAVPPPPLNLPTDHPRPAEQGEQTYPAGCARVELPPALIQDLKALGREHGATFYMVLLAAYAALLYRHGGCEDILIGAPTSKRNHPALERLVGHFAGRSWLRVDLAGNPSFLEALARTKRVVLSALENQYLTLRQWLDAVAGQVEGFSSRPLYAEATFNLWPPISGDIELPGACLSPIPIEYKVVHTDVALNLWEEPAADGALLKGFWLYRRDLFDPPRVERMVADFRALLEAAAADPAQSVTAIRLRSSSLRSLPLEKGEI